MASITFDGQSFIVDGRRLWLVGGTIQYARLGRDQWASRIWAAKLAGLNTVTTSMVWARHEARPAQFDFTGDNDIRHFVQLVHQAGMYCILRVGPFVGDGFDFGGLPAWVPGLKDVKLRTANQPFLEASSRFIGAVAKQVRDLQVTVPQFPGDTHGGPIVLVQSEMGWTCGHDGLAHGYLGELNRYIHESGFEVPVVNANNLWEGVEGEVDGWVGNRDLAAVVRQLSAVRPNQPRLVVKYVVSEPAVWGEDAPKGVSPERLQRDLMGVLASAGQFNVEPFAGGTNFAFSAGRL
ncbi:MAG: beta-galactosidase, partial [Phycisphaerales bacterium]|nr:beta-galactosidase [Phycisphaerales bacterium]